MALRVVEVFELFARERQPLVLSEIARLLGMPVSTCLGLLRTLEEHGYLYAIGRRQGYYPTSRLLAMARVIDANDPVLERVKPVMAELRDTGGETVVFGKLREDGRVVYLHVADAAQRVRYSPAIGEMRPAYANSLGRALLSTLSPSQRLALLQAMRREPLTDATLTGVAEIEAELAASQARGWFGNVGESVADLIGIAWPLRIGGQTYALSSAGPRYRMASRVEEMAAMLRAACMTIEQKG